MYEELANKYREDELRRTSISNQDNLDIKVFERLITQVANETMEQSHADFNHISMNSNYSANQANIDELD